MPTENQPITRSVLLSLASSAAAPLPDAKNSDSVDISYSLLLENDNAVSLRLARKAKREPTTFVQCTDSIRVSHAALDDSGRKLARMELPASCRSSSRVKPCWVWARMYSLDRSDPKKAGSSELSVTSS